MSYMPFTIIVIPDRTLFPEAFLNATGRKVYLSPGVTEGMPRGEGVAETAVTFFFVLHGIGNVELEREFASRCLNPADPYSIDAAIKTNPGWFDFMPVGTHWKDADGNWCGAEFFYHEEHRKLLITRMGISFWFGSKGWWFAGIPIGAG